MMDTPNDMQPYLKQTAKYIVQDVKNASKLHDIAYIMARATLHNHSTMGLIEAKCLKCFPETQNVKIIMKIKVRKRKRIMYSQFGYTTSPKLLKFCLEAYTYSGTSQITDETFFLI